MNKKEPKIKIFVSHHKTGYIYEDDVFVPIHVGKINSKFDLGIIGDDTGDNISNKNSKIAELTAQYWVWKNYDLSDVDYVGFCHYRRYMTYKFKPNFYNFLKNIFYIDKRFGILGKLDELKEGVYIDVFSKKILQTNTKFLKDFLMKNGKDIYLPKREICIKRKILSLFGLKSNTFENYNDDNYIWSNNKKFNDDSRKMFRNKYPEYWDAYAKLRENDDEKMYSGNHRNMFIMKKELFFEYSKWLFNYIFEIEKYIEDNNVDTSKDWGGDSRFIGIFSEKLINYFVAYERLKGKNISFDSNILFFK